MTITVEVELPSVTVTVEITGVAKITGGLPLRAMVTVLPATAADMLGSDELAL